MKGAEMGISAPIRRSRYTKCYLNFHYYWSPDVGSGDNFLTKEGDNIDVMNEIVFNGSRLIYLNKIHLKNTKKNNKITTSTLGNEQCLYKEKNHRYINPRLPYSSQIGIVKKMEV